MDAKHFTTIEIKELSELHGAVTRLVADIRDRVIPLQNASGRQWSEIRFELWIDSGRVIAFPAQSPLLERVDIAGCQICCDELAQTVAELDAAEPYNSEYDDRFAALESRVANVVRDAVRNQLDIFSIRDLDDQPL